MAPEGMTRTTVRDLREQLDALPDDAPVFTYGYEGGYNDAGKFTAMEIALNVNEEWYYGDHEDAGPDTEGKEVVKGFVI